MIKYFNPDIVLLPEPKGIDIKIQQAQINLGNNLPWLEKVFGRATLHEEYIPFNLAKEMLGAIRNSRNNVLRYPEVYQAGQEPLNVMPNDNLSAYCFFYTQDPESNNISINGMGDYDLPEQQFLMTKTVDVIVWGNLKKIDSTKDFRFAETLKIDVLRILRATAGVQISQSFDHYDNVFDVFTITTAMSEMFKPPYFGFRIRCKFSYSLVGENGDCDDVPFFIPPSIIKKPSQFWSVIYTATGDEDSVLVIPELKRKEILLIVRDGSPIYEVLSSNPDSSSFTWQTSDDPLVEIDLGTPVMPRERFNILYKLSDTDGNINSVIYTATGAEGDFINYPILSGKKILLIVREGSFLYETNVSPDSSSFLWQYSLYPYIKIQLSVPLNPGERFNIIYRDF